MIDPDSRRVPEGGPQGLYERLIPGRAQAPGIEGRHAPVLAGGVEGVGRRPHRHPLGELVLPGPGVGPVGVDAHRQVVDQPCAAARRRHLNVELELQPLVEADAVGVGSDEARHRRRPRISVRLRPVAPGPAMHLRQRAEDRVVVEPGPLLAEAPQLSPGPPPHPLPGCLQGRHLELVDLVAVDERGPVQALARSVVDGFDARHLLQPQVERVQEAPARGVVGARLLGQSRQRRVEGVEEQEGRAQVVPGPTPEGAQVGEVPDPGAARREQRVELHREAEAPEVGRQVGDPRAHDQPPLAVLADQGVVAGWQVAGQPAPQPYQRAVLGDQAGLMDGVAGALAHDQCRAIGRGRLAACPHRPQQRRPGLRRRLPPLPRDVVVAGRDAPRLRIRQRHRLVG